MFKLIWVTWTYWKPKCTQNKGNSNNVISNMNFEIVICVVCISIHLYSVVSFPHRSFELPKGIQTPQTRCPRADFT